MSSLVGKSLAWVFGSSTPSQSDVGADWQMEGEEAGCPTAEEVSVAAAKLLDDREEMKRLLKNGKGLPKLLRGAVWPALCGARDLKLVNRNYYSKLSRKVVNKRSAATEQIDLDLPRTFPTLPYFQNQANMDTLRRILVAFAGHNKTVGYTQSLNFVAATLIMQMPEEDAFWTLVVIVEDLLPGFYSDGLTGLRVDMRCFETLLRDTLPSLNRHMVSLCMDIASIVTPWFLCLFTTTLPMETALCVMDAFMFEGAPALLRTGLAVLRALEPSLLRADDFVHVYQVLTEGCRALSPEELASTWADREEIPTSAPPLLDRVEPLREYCRAVIAGEDSVRAWRAKQQQSRARVVPTPPDSPEMEGLSPPGPSFTRVASHVSAEITLRTGSDASLCGGGDDAEYVLLDVADIAPEGAAAIAPAGPSTAKEAEPNSAPAPTEGEAAASASVPGQGGADPAETAETGNDLELPRVRRVSYAAAAKGGASDG